MDAIVSSSFAGNVAAVYVEHHRDGHSSALPRRDRQVANLGAGGGSHDPWVAADHNVIDPSETSVKMNLGGEYKRFSGRFPFKGENSGGDGNFCLLRFKFYLFPSAFSLHTFASCPLPPASRGFGGTGGGGGVSRSRVKR